MNIQVFLRLMVRQVTIIISLIFIILGCKPSEEEVKHPDFSRLPSDEEVDYSINLSVPNAEPFPELFDLDSLEYISTIGSLSSLDTQSYYDSRRVRRMDMDLEGNIYITQFHTSSINVYNANGIYLYTIGGEGRGPGEFERLEVFTFSQDYKRLYALDFFHIEIFEYNDGMYEYKTTVPHEFTRAHDLCVLGNNLFVAGYRPATNDTTEFVDDLERQVRGRVTLPITRYDTRSLKPVSSFGYEYPSASGFGSIDGQLSQMILSCNESSGIVVGYQQDFPFIFGYDQMGRQKWISRVDGTISPLHIEYVRPEPNWPGLVRYMNETIFHGKYPITIMDKGLFELIQYVNQPPNPSLVDVPIVVKDLKFRTVLLNTSTGEMKYSNAYDRISLVKGDRVIIMERDPETFQRIFHIYEY